MKKLIIGPNVKESKPYEDVIKKHNEHIRSIWEDSMEESYGINRIFRLFLCISSFLFPALYIRHLSNKWGYIIRKLAVEGYSLTKLFFPIIILKSNFENNVLLILTFYLLIETILYLVGLIFLSDIYSAPHNSKRSMLLVLINYFEITFSFAFIYKILDLVGTNTSLGVIPVSNLTSNIATYFSFIISSTIGFGDYVPTPGLGYKIVVFHSSTILLFLILFVNHFVSILNESRGKKNKKKNAP